MIRVLSKMLSIPTFQYKTKHKNNASDWQVIENTHEAIIDKETFDAVQKIRQTRRRIDTIDKVNVLTGLVFCADCGSKMYNHRGHRVRGKVGKDGRPDIDSYECSTYKLTRKHEDVHCFSHYISNFALRSLLLDVIRETATHAIIDPDAFMQRILQESQIKRAEKAKELRRKAARSCIRSGNRKRVPARCMPIGTVRPCRSRSMPDRIRV